MVKTMQQSVPVGVGGNYPNLKCGEIYCVAAQNFIIICAICDMKTYAFEDYVSHFRNKHVELMSNSYVNKFTTDEGEFLIKSNNGKSLDKPRVKDDKEYTYWVEVESEAENGNDENQDQLQCYELLEYKNGQEHRVASAIQTCELDVNDVNSTFESDMPKSFIMKCSICGKEFTKINSFKNHERRHTHYRPHKCNYCEKAFFTTTELEFHRLTHTGETRFVCEECGMRYKKASTLKEHKRRHTGVKSYSCKDCNKSFYESTLLNRHRAVHSSDRPFKCDVCHAAFSWRKNLDTHKNLHSDIKKFVCKICGNRYAQPAGLYSHMKTHKVRIDISV